VIFFSSFCYFYLNFLTTFSSIDFVCTFWYPVPSDTQSIKCKAY
jgi:hypothetical protein